MTATVPAPPDSPPVPRDGDAPLGVVVVSYGSADLLRRTLARAGLPGPDVRVVVVDNYSSEANRRAVRELGAASPTYSEDPLSTAPPAGAETAPGPTEGAVASVPAREAP